MRLDSISFRAGSGAEGTRSLLTRKINITSIHAVESCKEARMMKMHSISTLVLVVFGSSIAACDGEQGSQEPPKDPLTVKALCQASFDLEDSSMKRVSKLSDLPQEKCRPLVFESSALTHADDSGP